MVNPSVKRLANQEIKAIRLKWQPLPDIPESMWRRFPDLREWWDAVQVAQRQNERETRRALEELASRPS